MMSERRRSCFKTCCPAVFAAGHGRALLPALHGHEHAGGADERFERIVEFVARVDEAADLGVPADATFLVDVRLDYRLEHEYEAVGMVHGHALDQRPLEGADAHAGMASWRQLDAPLFDGELHAFDDRVVDAALRGGEAIGPAAVCRRQPSDVAFVGLVDFQPRFSAGVDDGLVAVGAEDDREFAASCRCQRCLQWRQECTEH